MAGSWRDSILREFPPGAARLTLVADPDALFVEDGVQQVIQERGFDVLPFEDSVAFRFVYESQFRTRWEAGVTADLVVVLHAEAQRLQTLPYDLLQAGRTLAFHLGELFPNLSYPVLAALDRADLDVLYEAYVRYHPTSLGEEATKDFVLRHVFGVAPELLKEPVSLLRVLLSRHYRGKGMPPTVDEYLVRQLRKQGQFSDWPLERIVPERTEFFGFLQERWLLFVDRLTAGRVRQVRETSGASTLTYPGPP